MNFQKMIPVRLVGMVLTLVFLASGVMATNGYFSHGYSVPSKGLAGVGVAWPDNSLMAANNPAGMVWVGSQYDIQLALFNPNREFTVTGNPSGMAGTFPLTPGTVESGSKLFLVPALGANWMLNPTSSFGVSIFGNGGMNTNYDTKVFDSPMATVTSPTGVDLSQLFVGLTFAKEVAGTQAFGITGIFAYQRFEAKGLQAFGGFSTDPTKLTDNSHDNSTGFGARFGYLGRFGSHVRVGAAYQTKIYMSEFSNYAGLFAEQGDFDIPSNFTAGIAVLPTAKWVLLADVQYIKYSEIKAIANPMDPADFQNGILLGSDNGAGFGWQDMTTYKFGIEWHGIPELPLRAGYSYGKQPIPDSEMMFNILAPGVIEQHLSFGFSRQMCGNKELSFAVTHAFTNSVSGPNPMEVPNQQTIELKMNQWEFALGFGF